MVKGFQKKPRGSSGKFGLRAARVCAAGLVAACAALLLFAPSPAAAARRAHHHHRLGAVGFAPLPVSASIVLDADTGRVLSEDNADGLTYPASLAKLMTLYLTFEDMNSGRLRLDQYLPVSAEAASRPPTRLGLQAGEAVQVQDLILAIVTRSANDAAAVLAEAQAGSEAAFAEHMTRKARELGLTNTVFRNASGLPDPEQRTTARDMAQLALALFHNYPREYRYFAAREFEFQGRLIVGHDHLLDWYPGADGLKTGYIRASGFNLATSAVRDGHRLIGVVMGGTSGGVRDREMAALLDQGFVQLGVVIAPTDRHVAPSLQRPALTAASGSPADRRAAPPLLRLPVTAASDPPGEPGPVDSPALSAAAARFAAHLAPVARAEAAVAPRAQHAAATADRWSIQLGAFHKEAAAHETARAAASLAVAKGKPSEIVESGKTAKARLYRARLTDFTPQQAQSACAALHKKRLECIVVPPPLRVANR
jgi:D-alanyl-D-alanine carboxypeptidase